MSIESQYEREERDIQEQHACGEISAEVCNRLIQELWRDYRAAAQEAAQEAYEEEIERW